MNKGAIDKCLGLVTTALDQVEYGSREEGVTTLERLYDLLISMKKADEK